MVQGWAQASCEITTLRLSFSWWSSANVPTAGSYQPVWRTKTYLEMVQKSYLNWNIAPDAEVGGRGYRIPAQEEVGGFQGKEGWNRAGWATDEGGETWSMLIWGPLTNCLNSLSCHERPDLLPCIWQRASGEGSWHNLKPSTASWGGEWRERQQEVSRGREPPSQGPAVHGPSFT